MSGILTALMGSGTTGTQCEVVTIDPSGGTSPLSVNLNTQAGGHIFYTRVSSPFGFPAGVDPTHTGDVATGITVRVGTNDITINTGSGYVIMRALCYQSGFVDSDISQGDYEPL